VGSFFRSPSWHMWITSILLFALYLFGLYDYVMVHTLNEDYLLSLDRGTAVIDYFTGYPLFLSAVWAVNIAGGLLAPVLLLIRHRLAPEAAFISFIAMLLLLIITFTIFDRLETFGHLYSLFDTAILLVTAAFGVYSLKLRNIGSLSCLSGCL
jgi:hypothetical protein